MAFRPAEPGAGCPKVHFSYTYPHAPSVSKDVKKQRGERPLSTAISRARLAARDMRMIWVEPSLALLTAIPIVVAQAQAHAPWHVRLIDLSLCLAAALTGRWAVGGSATSIALIALILLLPREPTQVGQYTAFITVFSLGFRRRFRLRPWVTGVLYVLLLAGTHQRVGSVPGLWPYVAFWAFFLGVPWLLGNGFASFATGQEQARARALSAQRQDIARDLHDTVAHSLSLMVMRAQQAKLRGDASADDLDFLITTGTESIAELRTMLALMRAEARAGGADEARTTWKVDPLPKVLDRCVHDLRKRGFSPDLSIEGDPARLPAVVSETLAKIARESTANMVKHGDPAGPCALALDIEADRADLVFTNKPGVRVPTDHEGLGLTGIRERAEALGGRVDAGSTPGTWMTCVSVPLAAADRRRLSA